MKVQLAALMMTPGVQSLIAEDRHAAKDIATALRRHANGDWGDVCQEDKNLNDEAVTRGMRVLSAYNVTGGTKIWIITEADRSITTILFPNEY
jgi:hypothetical protein